MPDTGRGATVTYERVSLDAAWHLQGISIYETPFTNGLVLDREGRRLFVPQGYTPVLAARFEARAIVREGMADVLAWLGEKP